MVLQHGTEYSRRFHPGHPGMVARTLFPHYNEIGKLGTLPTIGGTLLTDLTPGAGLVYDDSNNTYNIPATDAASRDVVGILGYEANEVSPVSSGKITYKATEVIKVWTMGIIYVRAGSTVPKKHDLLRFDPDTQTWIKREAGVTTDAAAYYADVQKISVVAVNDASANGLIMARLTGSYNK